MRIIPALYATLTLVSMAIPSVGSPPSTAPSLAQDIVKMQDGRVLRGHVVDEGQTYLIENEVGKVQVKKADVSEIRKATGVPAITIESATNPIDNSVVGPTPQVLLNRITVLEKLLADAKIENIKLQAERDAARAVVSSLDAQKAKTILADGATKDITINRSDFKALAVHKDNALVVTIVDMRVVPSIEEQDKLINANAARKEKRQGVLSYSAYKASVSEKITREDLRLCVMLKVENLRNREILTFFLKETLKVKDDAQNQYRDTTEWEWRRMQNFNSFSADRVQVKFDKSRLDDLVEIDPGSSKVLERWFDAPVSQAQSLELELNDRAAYFKRNEFEYPIGVPVKITVPVKDIQTIEKNRGHE